MDHAEFIATLDGDLEPLQRIAAVPATGGGHRPALFTPMSAATITRYEQLHAFSIAPRYREILKRLNGARVFEMKLFGIPPSMAQDPPLLNRSVSSPLDLATANRHWKFEYQVPHDWFHFGGAPLSYSENVGYFFDSAETVVAIRIAGQVEGQWSEFQAFLSDELDRCRRYGQSD